MASWVLPDGAGERETLELAARLFSDQLDYSGDRLPERLHADLAHFQIRVAALARQRECGRPWWMVHNPR